MKKIVTILLGAVLALGLAAVPAHAAAVDEPELSIVRVGYNAAGPDTLTNRWQEYIDIKNTSGKLLNIKGWFTQDQWAHAKNGNKAGPADCNTAIFTKSAFPWLDTDADDEDGVEDGLWLPKDHYLRIYTGGAVDNSNNSVHSMVINKASCGYNGHYLNNGGDTIRVKKADGTLVATFVYDFKQGYWTVPFTP